MRSTSTCEGSTQTPRALDDDVRTELAHVFPSLTALATGATVALQHERYRSHRAVRALLEQLASTQPLVLVLDDLHWADSASIELLGALLRRPPAAPVLRARRPSAPDARALSARSSGRIAPDADPHRARRAQRRRGRELLGDAVDASTRRLYEESGGNPFYLEQLAGRSTAAGRGRSRRRRWRRSASRPPSPRR
jgi:hypothetical protein